MRRRFMTGRKQVNELRLTVKKPTGTGFLGSLRLIVNSDTYEPSPWAFDYPVASDVIILALEDGGNVVEYVTYPNGEKELNITPRYWGSYMQDLIPQPAEDAKYKYKVTLTFEE